MMSLLVCLVPSLLSYLTHALPFKQPQSICSSRPWMNKYAGTHSNTHSKQVHFETIEYIFISLYDGCHWIVSPFLLNRLTFS